jgi:hypothetical protein
MGTFDINEQRQRIHPLAEALRPGGKVTMGKDISQAKGFDHEEGTLRGRFAVARQEEVSITRRFR